MTRIVFVFFLQHMQLPLANTWKHHEPFDKNLGSRFSFFSQQLGLSENSVPLNPLLTHHFILT